MTAWELPLPYDKPPLNLNQRLHWAVKAKRIADVRRVVCTLAQLRRLPKQLDRVAVTLHWQPSTVRPRDTDNPMLTVKAAIDGLRDYGLVADDDSSHVLSGVVIEPVKRGNPRTWLRIEALR